MCGAAGGTLKVRRYEGKQGFDGFGCDIDPFYRSVGHGAVRVCGDAEAGARLVFLAGACPLDEDGVTVGRGDHAAQAARCVENMTVALAEAGASLMDVISTRVLVASTDRADLVTAWNVVRDAFAGHEAPSTLLGVTVLGYEHQLVEIEAVAAVRD